MCMCMSSDPHILGISSYSKLCYYDTNLGLGWLQVVTRVPILFLFSQCFVFHIPMFAIICYLTASPMHASVLCISAFLVFAVCLFRSIIAMSWLQRHSATAQIHPSFPQELGQMVSISKYSNTIRYQYQTFKVSKYRVSTG